MSQRIFFLLIFLLFTASFTLAQNDPEPLENGVVLSMKAPLNADGEQEFAVILTTRDIYDCSNAYLVNEFVRKGEKLTWKIKGVAEPEECDGEMGPIKTKLKLAELPVGDYKLRLIINMQVFKANLKISDGYYELRTDADPDLLEVPNGRLNRIPMGVVWGRISYSEAGQKSTAESIVADLIKAGATPVDITAGDYDAFYIYFDSQPRETSLGPGQYAFDFVLNYPQSLEELRPMLDTYKGKIRIRISNHREKIELDPQ